MSQQRDDRLVELRRDLHRHPEVGWTEFYTTARIVEELDRIGVDELAVGPDVLAEDTRLGVPDQDTLEAAANRAVTAGADPDLVAKMAGGLTGTVAGLEGGDGPTVALRVDIDGLPRQEASGGDHRPARDGFRSTHEGEMHACGHDAHAAIGVGVVEALSAADLPGSVKVIFQPAEELIGGGKPVTESGHLDDVDYLLAVHVGLDHPTGEVVAGIDGFLAVTQFRAEFQGKPAHAGGQPADGHNAVQAMSTAVNNLYAIPRHQDGATRVNAGHVGGGSATNIVPESSFIEGEVRGATTPLRDYMLDRAEEVLRGAATMHRCDWSLDLAGQAPRAESDDELVDVIHKVATNTESVDSPVRRGRLGGSEDATYLMRYVQERGGLACYVGVGTDHPGGHHTATFDVDEHSIRVGVDVLAESIRQLAANPPG